MFFNPLGSSKAENLAPTFPSNTASAAFSLVIMKGRSNTLNSGTKPVTGEVVGTTISSVPIRTASVARTSSPNCAFAYTCTSYFPGSFVSTYFSNSFSASTTGCCSLSPLEIFITFGAAACFSPAFSEVPPAKTNRLTTENIMNTRNTLFIRNLLYSFSII